MHGRIAAALLITCCVIAAVVFARRDETAPAPAGSRLTAPATIAAKPPGPLRSTATGQDRTPQPLPHSFDDTNIDGGVDVDANGRITPTRALRDLFDYYLSGVGEYAQLDASAAVKTRLSAYARRKHFSGPVRRQLISLFDRYMAYRYAAAVYIKQRQSVDSAGALGNLSDMRIAYLGAEMADAFFGDQERLARAAIARRRAQAGAESLTAAQSSALAPVDLARRVDAMRKNGADEATVAAAREQTVGRAATERLEALDAKRTRFDQKLGAYRDERARLMKSGMAETDRRKALAALRKRYFSPRNIRRVEALDDQLARRPPAQ